MTAEQRAPFAAFVVLLIASIVVLANAMRTDAMGSLFVAPAQSVIAGARLSPIPDHLLAAGVAAVAREKREKKVETPATITDQVVTHMVAVSAARSVTSRTPKSKPRSGGRSGGSAGTGAVLQQPVQAITSTLNDVAGLTAGVLSGTTQIVSTAAGGVVSSAAAPAAAPPTSLLGPLATAVPTGSGAGVKAFGAPATASVVPPTASTPSRTPSRGSSTQGSRGHGRPTPWSTSGGHRGHGIAPAPVKPSAVLPSTSHAWSIPKARSHRATPRGLHSQAPEGGDRAQIVRGWPAFGQGQATHHGAPSGVGGAHTFGQGSVHAPAKHWR